LLSFRFATRASTDSNIRVCPGIEFLPIERDAALADGDLRQRRAYLVVEAVAVHTEVRGRVAVANEAREDHADVRSE